MKILMKLMVILTTFSTLLQVQCFDSISPVLRRMEDVTEDVDQLKRDVTRVEQRTKHQIEFAKVSLRTELIQDINQHVNDAMSKILEGETIEELVRSHLVREVNQLKRRQRVMKSELRHLLKSLKDVKEDHDAYKQSLHKSETYGKELTCVVVKEERDSQASYLRSNNVNPSPLEKLVQNMSVDLQSTKTEQSLLRISLGDTTQDLLSTRSELEVVRSLLNNTRRDILATVGNVQEMINTTKQSAQSKFENLQASINASEQGQLSTESEVASVKANIKTLESTFSAELANLAGLVNVTKHAGPTVYFKSFKKHTQHFHKGAIIIFDDVINNTGNAYNSASGAFTAPVSGIYMVSVIIGAEGSGGGDFSVSSPSNVEAYVSIPSGYNTGPMTFLAHLDKGEQLFVKRAHGGRRVVRGWRLTQFSGFLLRAD